MKNAFLLLALLLSHPLISMADNDGRKDSFDVKKYTLTLDVSDFKTKQVKGMTDIAFTSAMNNLSVLRLDFFRLTVDSVQSNGKNLVYAYNDSLLHVTLNSPIQKNDSGHIQVFYHGKPAVDKGGFGGLVLSDTSIDGGYAYVLGVSFNFIPHTFGRGWFPCVDNFTDKALYEFYITTKSNHKAFCNGLLLDSSVNTNGTKLWHWRMNQPIVPYLAAIAAANYFTVTQDYNGLQHSLKLICAMPSYDHSTFTKGFALFNAALAGFEKDYGLYRFDRVGYFGMPFNLGAMESASNIGLPNIIYTDPRYRDTWAHELSHHWWGDLMTCASAEEMWLNEGWADFSESIFEENTLGHIAYVNYARANHYNVVANSFIDDKGFRALSPMPQQYTYGTTIYRKGGDAAHTLRAMLGDSQFFISTKAFLDSFAFKSATSEDFRKSLILSSGKDSIVNSFFNNWIYSPGLPHFSMDSSGISNNGNGTYSINANMRQKQWHSPALCRNVPLQVSAFDSNWKRTDVSFIAGGNNTNFTTNLNFQPVFIALNIENQIMDATTKEYKIVLSKNNYTYAEEMLTLPNVSGVDSALVFVEHHWVGPDHGNPPPGTRISTERYWTIDGIWKDGFTATATISYNGASIASGGLDSILMAGLPEDSVRLLYRPNAQSDWLEYNNYKKIIGNIHDHQGTITINNLKKGDYTFGSSYIARMGIDEKKPLAGAGISIYPNPAKEYITIKNNENISIKRISIYDLKGTELEFINTPIGNEYKFNTGLLASGAYVVKVITAKGSFEKKIVVGK